MKNRGFTFLELLAAMTILTVALVPMMRIMPEGFKSSRMIERWTKAAFLAQNKMGQLRSQILGNDSDYGFDKTDGYAGSGNFTTDPAYYYTVSDDEGSGIKELSVTVWFDEDGDGIQDLSEQSVRIDTKIADRG